MTKQKKRQRRSPEQSREAILSAAEELLSREGPEGVKLQAIAKEAGMSHATVLYHFKSADLVKHALSARISRSIRDELLERLESAEGDSAKGIFDAALAAISNPERAPLLAWLIASGQDPFPDAAEQGLASISARLAERAGVDEAHTKPLVLLSVLAMFGEALVGQGVRERLGAGKDKDTLSTFRAWLLKLIDSELRRLKEGGP